jgi:hypothetical protein
MAAKKRSAFNKSAAIREALAQYPNKGPAELARILTDKHGVPFRRKAISSIKAKVGQKLASAQRPTVSTAAQKTPAGRPTSAAGGVAVMVTNLQVYIQRLGKEDLHRLIDTL